VNPHATLLCAGLGQLVQQSLLLFLEHSSVTVTSRARAWSRRPSFEQDIAACSRMVCCSIPASHALEGAPALERLVPLRRLQVVVGLGGAVGVGINVRASSAARWKASSMVLSSLARVNWPVAIRSSRPSVSSLPRW